MFRIPFMSHPVQSPSAAGSEGFQVVGSDSPETPAVREEGEEYIQSTDGILRPADDCLRRPAPFEPCQPSVPTVSRSNSGGPRWVRRNPVAIVIDTVRDDLTKAVANFNKLATELGWATGGAMHFEQRRAAIDHISRASCARGLLESLKEPSLLAIDPVALREIRIRARGLLSTQVRTEILPLIDDIEKRWDAQFPDLLEEASKAQDAAAVATSKVLGFRVSTQVLTELVENADRILRWRLREFRHDLNACHPDTGSFGLDDVEALLSL